MASHCFSSMENEWHDARSWHMLERLTSSMVPSYIPNMCYDPNDHLKTLVSSPVSNVLRCWRTAYVVSTRYTTQRLPPPAGPCPSAPPET